MRKELEILNDLADSNGKVIAKDVMSKQIFELNDILVQQFISNRGKIVKKYCTILYNNNYYKVNSPYEQISKLTLPIEIKGFAAKSKTHANKQSNTNK